MVKAEEQRLVEQFYRMRPLKLSQKPFWHPLDRRDEMDPRLPAP